MSEIDQIFAAKGKASVADAQLFVPPSKSNPSKRKRKHRSNGPQPDTPGNDSPSDRKKMKKRPEPETVIDPSFDINPKRPKVDRTNVHKAKPKRSSDKDDEKTFKDSRGSTGRRTTEEGWLIYKEAELGIREDGGDTPLCPFDCECCF